MGDLNVAVARAHPNEPAIPIETAYGDTLGDLVRAAVADRPLEDVVHLITLLEQSPQYAQATAAALRAVGVDRSVDDVTRLVALLTRPPRDPDSADGAIRAAAESRPVEDVTRLVAMLNRSELQPHCGQEAVRAAATGRPVEELVELIGRLAQERPAQPSYEPSEPHPAQEEPAMPGPHMFPAPPPHPPAPRRAARTPVWPGRLAALFLLVCGVLCFPAHRDGASRRVHGFAVGVSALCAVLAVLLAIRPVVPLLALPVVLPAGVAAGQLLDGHLGPSGLSRALELPLPPAWLAGTAAACASLAALTALVVPARPERPPAERPVRETADAPLTPWQRSLGFRPVVGTAAARNCPSSARR